MLNKQYQAETRVHLMDKISEMGLKLVKTYWIVNWVVVDDVDAQQIIELASVPEVVGIIDVDHSFGGHGIVQVGSSEEDYVPSRDEDVPSGDEYVQREGEDVNDYIYDYYYL